MKMMEKLIKFNVEGPDWKHEVQIDPDIFDSERDLYIEAASEGIEKQIAVGELNLGPLVIVKKEKSKKEALVNSYICLNNVSHYKLAEELRQNYLKQTNGQDLAVDTQGYSFTS